MKSDMFTPREAQVLQALWEQEGNIDYAGEVLKISPHTVRVHLTRIAHKLGTSGEGRSATLVRAHKDGYVK